MLRMIRTFARSLAVVIVAGAIAPTTVHALPPVSGLHLFARSTDKTVTFQLNNKSDAALQVKVAEQLYTLEPHGGVKITAPVGVSVVAATDGPKFKKGEVLFEVTKFIKNNTLSLD